MALSCSHIKLVQELKSFVVNEYGKNSKIIIYTDNPEPNIRTRVPSFCGFIPDLYARTYTPDLIILGEAKTVNDVDNRHSVTQYELYLKYCKNHPNSKLVFAVPWTVVASLKNKIRTIKNRLIIHNIDIIYIEPLSE